MDNPDDMFGLHLDDSLEVISNGDQSLNQPDETQQGGLSVCHGSVTSGMLSFDDE